MPELPPSNEYFILDLRHSGDTLLWWRVNNSGYTTRLDCAGRYSRATVESRLDYYNDGVITRAIPCADAEAAAVPVVVNDPPWSRMLQPVPDGDAGGDEG